MFSNIAIEVFERAEECRLEAQKTINPEERAGWLALAEDWLRLAQDTAVTFAPEEPVTTNEGWLRPDEATLAHSAFVPGARDGRAR